MSAFLKRFVTLAAVLFAALTLPAPLAWAQQSAQRQQEPYARGLLWKLERGSAPPSYIYGTIHLADPRVLALPAPVRKSFDSSNLFALEVKLDPEALLKSVGRLIYTDGRQLPAVIGPALYAKLVALAPTLGLPVEMLPLFKPWVIAMMLLTPGADPENVLDVRLQRMAVEQKKRVEQLETVDEQLDLFDHLAETEQVALLRNTVENYERMPVLVERMVVAYLDRDLDALSRIEAEAGADPGLKSLRASLMRRLVDDRNVRMTQRAEPLLKTGAAFIAVGALHLYGERGMLALFARRGYRVSRVY